jgi:hypothetical protein
MTSIPLQAACCPVSMLFPSVEKSQGIMLSALCLVHSACYTHLDLPTDALQILIILQRKRHESLSFPFLQTFLCFRFLHFKGSLTRDFQLQVFHKLVFPLPLKYLLGKIFKMKGNSQ